MTKVAQNFEMWQGDTKNLIFTVTGSDNSGYDLSGAELVYIMETEPSSGSLVRKATSGSGITVSTSTVTVTIDPADTLGMSGLYYHEMQAKDAASRISTVMVGNVKINKSGAN